MTCFFVTCLHAEIQRYGNFSLWKSAGLQIQERANSLCRLQTLNLIATQLNYVGRPKPRGFVVATMRYFERILGWCRQRGLRLISAL